MTRRTHPKISGEQARKLQDMMMLFPNHSEDELQEVLSETSFDLDEAISFILGQDNLANAPPAEEVFDDDPYFSSSGETVSKLAKRETSL